MAFSSTSLRRKRRGAPGFTDINVTPLVDVMLVLLVVFMVTAPMLTVGVPVDLPKTHAAKMNDQVEPIVISVDAQGRSYLQETELQGEALIARLIAITGSNPDAKIYVRGDKNIFYGRIMEIMGEVAAAGFSKVSLIAEMPTGKGPSSLKTMPTSPLAKGMPAPGTNNVPNKGIALSNPPPRSQKPLTKPPAVAHKAASPNRTKSIPGGHP